MMTIKRQDKGAKVLLGEEEREVNYSDEEQEDEDSSATLGTVGVTKNVADAQSTVDDEQIQTEVFVKTVPKNST